MGRRLSGSVLPAFQNVKSIDPEHRSNQDFRGGFHQMESAFSLLRSGSKAVSFPGFHSDFRKS